MGEEKAPAPVAVETPAVPPSAPKEPSQDWETRFKYLFADFENFRRRTEREKDALGRQSRAALLRELLPLVEAFRAAHDSSAHLPKDDPLRRGLELLDREWQKFLAHEGIEPVAGRGTPFRAEEAEAVGETGPTEEVPEGRVAEVVQQGYRFSGGLLRPAKVIVARARRPAEPPEAVAPDSDHTGGEAS